MKASILVLIALTAVLSNAAPPADICNGKLRQRKSFATLSDDDKNAYSDGVWAMKKSGKYDYFTKKHRAAIRWHQTTQFLPLHRAMMAEFEDELLKVAPTLTGLPFWDEFSDNSDAINSPIFASPGLGPMASGPLTGPFEGLTDDNGNEVVREPNEDVMADSFSWIPRNQVLAAAMGKFKTFGDMSEKVELTPHGTFHVVVGGHMGRPATSPSDSAFWLHHSYTDLMWAVYQGTSTKHFTDYTVLGSGSGKFQINPTAGVVMYEKQYTNTDMLYYRQRLCYEYVAPNTLPPAQRAAKALAAAESMATEGGDRESIQVAAKFAPIQPLPAAALQMMMPNMSLEQITKHSANVAAAINDAAASLNAKVKSATTPRNGVATEFAAVPVSVALARLPTMHDMIAQAAEVAASVIVDDRANSLIPAVRALHRD
ncbi:hypothetical protein BC828DRAFT_236989 [Blastocladiella britannica]|nr:hypothetical protein BC828DRAFT_236989 [Blastocladiella britannica]